MVKVTTRTCGDFNCSVSTGIHEGLTFGKGELDDLGYWEFPCRPCAEEWDRKNPGDEYGPAWPFSHNDGEIKVSRVVDEQFTILKSSH